MSIASWWRGRRQPAKPPAAPRVRTCYVQGCREPARWKDRVDLTVPSRRDGNVVHLDRIGLGLFTCDEHLWALDQALKAHDLKVAIERNARRHMPAAGPPAPPAGGPPPGLEARGS